MTTNSDLVFTLYDGNGTPQAGLAAGAAWLFYKEVVGNTSETPPAISELGSGIYSIPLVQVSGKRYVGLVDFGASSNPRYVEYDSPYGIPAGSATAGTVSAASPSAGPAGGLSLLDLRTQIRQRADMVGSLFVADAELNGYINASIQELHDLLEQSYGEEYFAATPYQVTTTSNNELIPLPTDFHKLLGVDAQLPGATPQRWATLMRFQRGERNRFTVPMSVPTGYGSRLMFRYNLEGSNIRLAPPPVAGQVLRIHYVPLTPILTDSGTITLSSPASTDSIYINAVAFSGALNAAQLGTAIGNQFSDFTVSVVGQVVTVTPSAGSTPVIWSSSAPNRMALSPATPVWQIRSDGFNGWLEYVVTDCVIKCKAKEESDVSLEMAQKAALQERIARASVNRNIAEPATVSDVQTNDGFSGGSPFHNSGWWW